MDIKLNNNALLSLGTTIDDNIVDNCTTIYVKDCPSVSGINILRQCDNLTRVRLDIGSVSGSLTELLSYSSLNGFNDSYEEQVKPRLVGTWTVDSYYTSSQLTQAQNAFDGLTIVADSSYLINFNDLAVQTLDSTQPNYNPAVAIVLSNHNLGTTLSAPMISGGGKWYLTKSVAATVTKLDTGGGGWFQGVKTVTDTNGIVSSDTTATYTFSSFTEFQYFTSVASVVGNGFQGCTNLEDITLPTSVTYLYTMAFNGCKKLKITSLQNIEYLGVYAFATAFSADDSIDINLPSLTTLVTGGNGGAQFSQSGIKTVTNLGSITLLSDSCFASCSNLESIVIPSTVTTIQSSSLTGVKAGCIIHLLPTTPPTMYTGQWPGTSKFYVGDGTSASDDNAILQAYLANTNWATYSSRLDTWYNYLHPTT